MFIGKQRLIDNRIDSNVTSIFRKIKTVTNFRQSKFQISFVIINEINIKFQLLNDRSSYRCGKIKYTEGYDNSVILCKEFLNWDDLLEFFQNRLYQYIMFDNNRLDKVENCDKIERLINNSNVKIRYHFLCDDSLSITANGHFGRLLVEDRFTHKEFGKIIWLDGNTCKNKTSKYKTHRQKDFSNWYNAIDSIRTTHSYKNLFDKKKKTKGC